MGSLFPALCEHWVLFPLILLGDSLAGFRQFLHAFVLISSQLTHRGSSSILHSSPLCSSHDPGSLCGDFGPPWCTVTQADSFPGLFQEPSSCAVAWKLRQSQCSSSYFLCLRDYSHALPDIQVLKTSFLYLFFL